jgi:hypothetical protein
METTKKFFKVYSGPGYPIDPKLEEERLFLASVPKAKNIPILHPEAQTIRPALQQWLDSMRN